MFGIQSVINSYVLRQAPGYAYGYAGQAGRTGLNSVAERNRGVTRKSSMSTDSVREISGNSYMIFPRYGKARRNARPGGRGIS